MQQYYDNSTYLVDSSHPYFEGIPSGPDFYIDSDFSITEEGDCAEFCIGCFGCRYEEFAPQIFVKACMEDGVVYFTPTLSMPPCSSDDLDFADSFEYLASLYMEAAKIATYLIKNPLNTEQYLDDEE